MRRLQTPIGFNEAERELVLDLQRKLHLPSFAEAVRDAIERTHKSLVGNSPARVVEPKTPRSKPK